MKGSIRAHGAGWQIKYDLPSQNGRRVTRYKTVRGGKKEAQRELRRLLSAVDDGSHVEPSRLTVGEYCQSRIDQWAAAGNISALTAEGYRRLLADYIRPHLGAITIQRLHVSDIEAWHNRLRAKVGARTIGAAHRTLGHCLRDAMRLGLLVRNPVSLVPAPRVDAPEIEIPNREQIGELIAKLRDRPDLHAPALVAIGCGLRRNEILGLRWSDWSDGMIRVERALEETVSAGIQTKGPKSRRGVRTVTVPALVADALSAHRRATLELRLACGAGRPADDAPMFGDPLTGGFASPRNFTKKWSRFAASIGFPELNFHALRHVHGSQLLASGIDIVTAARRMGHRPDVLLKIYAHTLEQSDRRAADAIDAALAWGNNREH